MSVEDLLRTLQAFDPLSIFPSIDTPYAKYSTSNYAASNVDILPIRHIISQYQEQLNVIDTILEQIKSTFHKLSDKREQIASSMKMHEGFKTCIRRLPADVLGDIFMQCLPDATYLTPDIRAAPLLLTRVCRGWREVMLGTPRLWCSLSIADIGRDRKRLFSLYKHWLGASGRCPLSLGVNLAPEFVGKSRPWQTMATEFLQLYTSRCTNLSIDSQSADGLDLLLADVPNLEHLYLRAPSPNISVTQPHPRLHTLVVVSPAFPTETLAFFNSGWPNLTHLAMSFRNNPQPADDTIFLTLLRTCPNLEILVFSPVYIHGPGKPITLTHSKLRTLAIEPTANPDVSRLHTLIFPNLRRLQVYSYREADDIFYAISKPEDSLPDGHRIVNMTFEEKHPTKRYSMHALFTAFNGGWMGLTHLRLDTYHGATSSLIPLQFCPQLEDMAVSIIVLRHTIPCYTPSVHPTLRSLTLYIGRIGDIGTLLAVLTLPSLRHLSLMMASHWPRTSFDEFFSRSNCPLETLEIRGWNVSKLGREEFTSLIPTLSQLDLEDEPDLW